MNAACRITALRIVLAAAMVLTPPFSAAFWLCYAGAGISDGLDGFVARKLNQQSAAGARLDSVADLFFFAAILWIAFAHMEIPRWMGAGTAAVAGLRLVVYGIGWIKFRAFSALHTWANKATGALLFAFPLLCALLGLTAAGAVLLTAALASSLEEGAILLTSEKLNRDRRSLWLRG